MAVDLGRCAVILCVGRPAQLERCEYPETFKLSALCLKSEPISAVGMLLQKGAMDSSMKLADYAAKIMKIWE